MNEMNEVNNVGLRGWLLGARPAPDENRLHPWGALLGLLNLLLFFMGMMNIGGGIDVADTPLSPLLLPLSWWAIMLPFICPLLDWALLAVRGHFQSRLGYYACTGLVVVFTAETLATLLPYIVNLVYIGQYY